MNKILLFYLLSSGFAITCYGQHKLVKTKINQEISMRIPRSFAAMSEEDMWQRVSSYRKSIALYTDPQRVVELGVNYSFATFEEGDYEMMKSWYKAGITQLFDEVNWEKEEIVEIGDHTFVIFELVSTITANSQNFSSSREIKKYQYLQYTLYRGNVLLVYFSCPVYSKDEWQPVAADIMGSIRLK